MAVKWILKQDNLIEFTISGKLTIAEYENVQSELQAVANKVGSCRVLAILDGFTGWESAKGWENASTDHIDPLIKKFAIVGDEKWRDLAEVFTLKGLRPVPIEYFSEGQEQLAREWLDA